MSRISTVACATVTIFSASCGGSDSTQPHTTITPTPESVTVAPPAVSLAGTTANLVASATSTLFGIITDPNKYTWTLDGTSLGAGNPLTVTTVPGQHSVCVVASGTSAKSTPSCTTFMVSMPVVPTLTGTAVVRTFTGEHCPTGAYVVVGDSGTSTPRDSVLVSSTGTCAWTLQTSWALQSNVRVVLHGDPNVITLVAHVDAQYYGRLELVTIARTQTVPSGQFAGYTRLVDLDLPYILSGDGVSSFFRRQQDTPLGPWSYVVANFPHYPVAEAFCRDKADQPIVASDSIGFMVQRDSLNLVMGEELFRFGSSVDVCVNNLGRQLYANSTHGTIPGSNVDSYTVRDFTRAWIDFGLEKWISEHSTVRHESLHTLGFGHTSPKSWKSIMCAGCQVNPSMSSNDVTQDDVFYFYVMQTMANGQRLHNTVFGLAQVHQGYRLEHHEAEEAVAVFEPHP